MTFRTDRRKHVEESGPFGKSRRGRSRTRPATTAKKEDPHIAYFGEALRFDQGRAAAADERQQAKSTRSRSSSQTGLLPPQATSSLSSSSGALASPESVTSTAAGTAVTTAAGAAGAATTAGGAAAAAAASVGATASARLHSVYEVLLYGYKPSLQYAALQRYETISRGHILEDYAREPPSVTAAAAVDTLSFGGGRRFRTLASFPAAAWRTLTHDERQRVNTYAGGQCWIKVTFDSALAGERAVAASPQAVHDYWVYAEPYRDQPPHRDTPIPVVLRGAPGGDGGGYGSTAAGDLASRVLRRPGTSAAMSPGSAADDSMSSSSTASSATATGYAAAAAAPVAPSRSELYRASAAASATNTAASSTNPTAAGRTRTIATTTGGPAGAAGAAAGAAGTVGAGAVGGAAAGAVAAAAAAAPEFCTAIPTARRIRLRPAEEAVLPARTLAERLAPYVPFVHLLPGGGGGGGLFSFFWGSSGDEGGHIPRLADGRLDYARAGVYWKLCFWLDHFFHTDLCGLKED
jgi:hypothetical protein